MTSIHKRAAQPVLAGIDELPSIRATVPAVSTPIAIRDETNGRARPGRIVRSERVRLGSCWSERRSALVDRLYAVYSETVRGDTRDEFEAQVFGTGEHRLVLFYGECDELAGFAYAEIERVEHAGRRLAVFGAGVCFRVGYCGGLSAALWGFRQALRLKLRAPFTPLAYCTRSSSPAVYRLLASTVPKIYPSRRCATPVHIAALAHTISARRKYVPVGDGGWVVRSGAIPRDPSRLRRLGRDPDVRFYTELNPRFAEGESLLVWIPLDAVNVARGLGRVLRARSAR